MCMLSCFSHVLLFVTLWDLSPPGSSVHGILQARILGVGCCALLQGIFPAQGSNPSLLRLLLWQADSLLLSKPESPDGCCRRWDQDEKNLEGVVEGGVV